MGLYPKEILEYIALAGIPRGYNSKVFVVDAVNGADTNSGDRWSKPLATLSAAKLLCVTGRNDVVLIVASGATPVTEAAAINWNLNQTHILGLGAETRRGKRTRIVNGIVGLDPFFTVSGYGNVLKNLRIVNEFAASTTNKVCVSVTGIRNYFENVEFAGPATVESAIDASCALKLTAASECMFKDCSIGLETVLQATGAMALVFAGAASQGVRFKDCEIVGYANSTSAGLVELLAVNCIDRLILFDRCEFVNLGPQTMASAFVVAAQWDPASKRVLLKDCLGLGFTDWEAAAQGAVYLSGGTHTGGGYTGLAQIAAVT